MVKDNINFTTDSDGNSIYHSGLNYSDFNSVFLTDPDGVRVQFYADRTPAGPVAAVDEDLDIYLA